MLKFFNTLVTALFIAMLLGVAGLLVGSMLPIPGNIEIKIVKSGSMEPAIPTGSLVVVKPASSYAIGDVITFGPDTQDEIPTTHRIMEMQSTGSERIFITKGDANEEIDQESVALREVIGKVVVSIPGAGFVLDFARQPLGFALLIGVPAGLIILEEVITIVREMRAALRRRRGEDETPKGGMGSFGDETALNLFYGRKRVMDEIFVPMYQNVGALYTNLRDGQSRLHADAYGTSTALVLGLVFISSLMAGGAGGTIAYFNDIERSVGNIFRAGQWTQEIQSSQSNAHNVVLNEFLPNPDGTAYGFDFGNDGSNMPQGEWIELYNMGTTSVDVAGWYMTDASGGVGNTHAVIDGTNTLPAGTIIAPGEWLVVYLNKPSLNDTGDSIFLYTSTSTGSVLVDSYTYANPSDFCELEPTPTDPNSASTPTGTPGNGPNADCPQAQVAPNKSYARIPDGTGAWVDPIPTPGSWNIPDPEPVPEPAPEETPAPEGGGGGGFGGSGGSGIAPEESAALEEEPANESTPEESLPPEEGVSEEAGSSTTPPEEITESGEAEEETPVTSESVEEPAPPAEEPPLAEEPPAEEPAPEVI